MTKDDIYYNDGYYLKAGDVPIRRKRRVVEGTEEWYWVDDEGNEYTFD